MIKGIYSGGRYTQVNNGSPNWPNVYNMNQGHSTNSQSFTGQMRYSAQSSSLEIFDGNNWQMMSNSIAQVGLTTEAELLLDWAKKKRDEELELESLAKTNPTIKDLTDQIKEKQDQIKMVKTLIKKEVISEGVSTQAYQPSIIP